MRAKQTQGSWGMLACAGLLALASLHFAQQVAAMPAGQISKRSTIPSILQQAQGKQNYIPVIMRQNNSFDADIQEFSRVMLRMNKVVSNRQEIIQQPTVQQTTVQKEDVSEFATSVVKDVVHEEVKDFLFKVSLVGRVGKFAANYFTEE